MSQHLPIHDEALCVIKSFLIDMKSWEEGCASNKRQRDAQNMTNEEATRLNMEHYDQIIDKFGAPNANKRQSVSFREPSMYDVSTMSFEVVPIDDCSCEIVIDKSEPWNGKYIYLMNKLGSEWRLVTQWYVDWEGRMIEGEL